MVRSAARNLVPVRRRFLVLPLVAAGLLLAGCGLPTNPEVTFYAAGTAVTVQPYRYCDIRVTHCTQHKAHITGLRVPAGNPVQISVPGTIAGAPWTVVIQYADAAGHQQPPRTVATFTPDARYTYTVRTPERGDRLQTIEVQEVGAAFAFTPGGKLITDPNGDPQLQTRAVWSVHVHQ